MATLSVFVDELGDFGPYDRRSPDYLVSLVFHDQSIDIAEGVAAEERRVEALGFARGHAIHTAPLIRREPPYAATDPEVRRRLFDVLFDFFRHCNVGTKTIAVSKREFGGGDGLSERIARELGLFIRENLAWFQSFDRVIVYYDRGQKQVTRVLKLVFLANLCNVEFRVVHPDEYKLFQVADLVCTLESLRTKLASKRLSKSETEFFRNGKRLKKNYLKWLDAKRIDA